MRIRSVKPEFWSSEDIAALGREERLLFLGLWSYVDDNGVGRDDFRLITADLFPLDDPVDARVYVREGLATLSRHGLIARYKIDSRAFLYVTGWKHQRVDKPGKPRYPLPPENWEPPPTSTNGASPEDAGTSSRDSRETLVPVTGEQRNRGTEEQRKKNTRPPAEPRAAARAPARARETPPDGFTEFWAAYPRRTAKRAAVKAYAAAVERGTEPGEILTATRRFATATAGSEARFIPHPATWLNQGRYDDEPQTALALVHGNADPRLTLRPSTTDQRVAQALALAARYEAEEAQEEHR